MKITKEIIERIEGEATLELEWENEQVSFAKIKFFNYRGIEEILKKLEALNKDKSSGKSDSLTDIENRIKQLREHLKEAQEKATGRSARNLDTDTVLDNAFSLHQEPVKDLDIKESLNNIKDGSVLKENQLLVASAGEQLRLMEQLKQNKK